MKIAEFVQDYKLLIAAFVVGFVVGSMLDYVTI